MKQWITLVMLMLVAGCVNLDQVGVQTITISTLEVEDAACTIYDTVGNRWRVRSTPGVVTVKKGHDPLTIICEKEGYRRTVNYVSAKRLELDAYNAVGQVVGSGVQFAKRPHGSVGKEFPHEVLIVMQPDHFESEEQELEYNARQRAIYELQR